MNFFKIFTNVKQFQVFLLGLYSAMPLIIIYVTLPTIMKEAGVIISLITSISITRVFYSLKFIWSPFLDTHYLNSKNKHLTDWMSLFLILISAIVSCYIYLLDVTNNWHLFFTLTFILGFISSSLDIVIDAWRIKIFSKEEQSVAAANVTFGYLMGSVICNAGGLWFADIYGWKYLFILISGLYVIGFFFVKFFVKDVILSESEQSKLLYIKNIFNNANGYIILLNLLKFTIYSIIFYCLYNYLGTKTTIIITFILFIIYMTEKDYFGHTQFAPLKNLLSHKHIGLILTAILFYKLGDAFLGVVAMPFYLDLGFTKTEIARIVKIYGLMATISGAYLGAYIMRKTGHIAGMIICGIAQSLTNYAFVWLNMQGHNTDALLIAIVTENIANGMGSAALVAYLSYLCKKEYSATQYAMLSSISGLFSHSIVSFGGSIKIYLGGWGPYFYMTIFLGFPAIILFIILYYKMKKHKPNIVK